MIKKWKVVFDLGSSNENRKDMELRKVIGDNNLCCIKKETTSVLSFENCR